MIHLTRDKKTGNYYTKDLIMKKLISLVIIIITLSVSLAYAEEEYYGHPDIYFPYEEINVGDVFWTDNCFIYYSQANGFYDGIDCYDDQAVVVVSKAEIYADHPIYVKGNDFEGWVDMDFFYCKSSEPDLSIFWWVGSDEDPYLCGGNL